MHGDQVALAFDHVKFMPMVVLATKEMTRCAQPQLLIGN